jgi:16S rRNA processing protein RimM
MAHHEPDRLLAAEVGKPHGLSGDVYVVPISDDPERFAPGSKLVREDGTTLTVRSSHKHGNRMLVRFEEASDRNSAEALRGPLFVSSSSLRDLPEGEYWSHQLIGCEVLARGEAVGRVVEIIPGAAQDLLRVSTASGPVLVPLVDEIVESVDVQGREIHIDPPEGLFDQ